LSSQEVTDGPKSVAESTIAFEDAVMVARCRKGDMQAFGVLVAKYQHRLLNVVLRICGSREDAEELAQEAFLRALERIDQFRGDSGFYTWLFRIATNLAISHRRRRGRARFQSLTGAENPGGSQANNLAPAAAGRGDPSPEAAAMAAETNRRVLEALEELDDEFRLVAILSDIEGMAYAEIAKVLQIPVGTVKSRLHRARCILKEKLADLVSER